MIHVIGVGMGPQHVTPEAAAVLRSCDYVIAASKRDGDELLGVRREICAQHDVELVVVEDPARDRQPADYGQAVTDWHLARVAAYRSVIDERGGTPGFLVWGDPALYDSTIRVVEQLDDYDVVPGISAPQALAAAHGMVLHEVGRPVLVTTERRLAEAVSAGADNIVVMLTSGFSPADLDDWHVWWGANLGTRSARLVAGRVADVADAVREQRMAAKAEAGWVMDLYLLRRVS